MSRPGSPVLRLEEVTKTYSTGRGRLRILDGVDLELRRGETTSMMGRSGSGKSTLIALAAGLLRPDAGRIQIGGQRTDELDDDARARLRATRIGIVLQSGNLVPFLTALENVELAMAFAPGGRSASRARMLLAGLGLGDRLHHLPRRLAGGEAQRVAVAVALANRPSLLLADEVVGQLDAATAASVTERLFAASREHDLAVLFVTHNEQLARRAQRRLRIVDRRVVPA
jgi:putative ABC transport system ATP-binding protein